MDHRFHIKAQICIENDELASPSCLELLQNVLLSLFFSTWPGRACSHWCCIFHRYMSRHETDQSPPINLQSCFSFFTLLHLFHASLCSKCSTQLSFSAFCLHIFSVSPQQHAHLAHTNQRGYQGARAPACRAPTCNTPPSLAAPPSATASASRAISQ